jgi:hypothetical protein
LAALWRNYGISGARGALAGPERVSFVVVINLVAWARPGDDPAKYAAVAVIRISPSPGAAALGLCARQCGQ